MSKIQKIKEQFAADLKKIEDAISFSSLSNLRTDVAKAVASAKENAEKHLNALEEANDRADQVTDSFLMRIAASRYTVPILIPLAIALFAAGLLVGLKL